MGKVDMNAPERRLLLYCETCATDHCGKMDVRHLNAWHLLEKKEE